jgi:Flp pilus assembly protein TadD
LKLPFSWILMLAATLTATGWDSGRESESGSASPPPAARDRDDARLRMAEALLSEGEIASAIEQLHRLAEAPEHQIRPGAVPEWADRVIERLIRRRAIQPADSMLRLMGPLRTRSANQQMLSANVMVLAGEIDQAVAIYSGIETDQPAMQVRVRHELASLYMMAGDPRAALDRARDGLALDPDHGPLRVLAAQALAEQGKPRLALTELEQLPMSAARWATEGEIYLDFLGAPDSALHPLRQANIEMPRDGAIRQMLGRAYGAAGKHELAINYLRPLASLPVPFENSQRHLAVAYRAMGRGAAADSLDAIVDARELHQRVQATRLEGLRHSVADELDAALASFERALELAPRDGELHHDRAVILARMERWDEAEAAFESTLELRPDDPTVHVNLARLFDRTGRSAERDAMLEAARALDAAANPDPR